MLFVPLLPSRAFPRTSWNPPPWTAAPVLEKYFAYYPAQHLLYDFYPAHHGRHHHDAASGRPIYVCVRRPQRRFHPPRVYSFIIPSTRDLNYGRGSAASVILLLVIAALTMLQMHFEKRKKNRSVKTDTKKNKSARRRKNQSKRLRTPSENMRCCDITAVHGPPALSAGFFHFQFHEGQQPDL